MKCLSSGYSREIDIIHNVSLEARKSNLTCIIGPNGAGKSTIIKTIYGFLRPRTGQIYHNNQEITGLRPYNMLMRGITYVPQARSIFPFLSVYENLKMGTWLFRRDKERASSSIKRICDMFPILHEKSNISAVSLSGGQQKILEIGVGTGFISRLLAKKGKFYGMDISQEMLDKASEVLKHARLIKGDILTKKIKDKFDTVVTVRVISHFNKKDATKALENIAKLLNKYGEVVFNLENKSLIRRIARKNGRTC